MAAKDSKTFDPFDEKADLSGMSAEALTKASNDMDDLKVQARDAQRRVARELQRRAAEDHFYARLAGLDANDVARLRGCALDEAEALVNEARARATGQPVAQVAGVGGGASAGAAAGSA